MSECLLDRKRPWFGHLERMEESVWSTEYRTFKVGNSLPRGQPWKTWNDLIKSDLKESKDKAKDENTWNSFIKKNIQPIQAWKADVQTNTMTMMINRFHILLFQLHK